MARFEKYTGLKGEVRKLLKNPHSIHELTETLNISYGHISSVINQLIYDNHIGEVGDFCPSKFQMGVLNHIPANVKQYNQKWKGHICDLNKFIDKQEIYKILNYE